jgi:hypothetical protein
LSTASSLLFQGQHILAEMQCTCCDIAYYHTVAIGHAAFFPVSFSYDGKITKFLPESEVWMAKPLIQSMLSDAAFVEAEIEVLPHRKTSKALFLNCLDDCWGHVFHKLLNAQKHLENDSDWGLIVLIPSNFKWLILDGVAEVWALNLPMKDLKNRIVNLDAFVKSQLPRFHEAGLSNAHVQPNASSINIEKFTKIAPFDLKNFYVLPPKITFIWREDRFWHKSYVEEICYLASVKYGFSKLLVPFFAWLQMLRFGKLAKRISEKIPNSQFCLVGLGTNSNPPRLLNDLRKNTFSEATEKEWVKCYAETHVIVGVHGSHMLLPTAMAAAFVELVPYWKLDRWGEDIAQPYQGRNSMFLGRILPGFSSSKLVAAHVVGVLRNYALFSKMLHNS